MPDRRQLKFQNWDQVRADLNQLLSGYEQLGKWNLAQMAMHLNDWLRFPMEGFPSAPLPINLMLSLVRMTVGPRQLRKMLDSGRMSSGTPTMPATVHLESSSEDEQQAVTKLNETIARFESFQGPPIASPVFGKMDKATAEKLQLVHFAHHLSWLIPR